MDQSLWIPKLQDTYNLIKESDLHVLEETGLWI